MSSETPAADNLAAVIAAEEAKRNRHLSAAQRFALIEQTIAWAEAQSTVQRNTKEACLREQARLLAQLQRSSE